MAGETRLGDLYRGAVGSWVAMAREFTAVEWATPVACTPGWTVRDVLSHVAGIPDDALAGRMEGAATAPWTAAQVDRNRHLPVADLIERWQRQTPAFADVLDQIGEQRPPFDCHSHEHDVRHALGRPGNRDSAIVALAGRQLAEVDVPDVAVRIDLGDGTVVTSGRSDGRPVALRGVTTFELFRSRLGRRSRAQVRDADWDGADADVDAVVARWFLFGPAQHPIVE